MANYNLKTKITQNTLKTHLKESEREKHDKQTIRDTEVQGLSLTIFSRPIGTWWVQFRPKGKTPDGKRFNYRAIKIGDTSTHSVDKARDKARRIKAAAIEGRDPHREAIQQREQDEAARLARKTLTDALTRYNKFIDKRFKAGDISSKHAVTEKLYARKAVEAITQKHKEDNGSEVVVLQKIEGKDVVDAIKVTPLSQHARKHMEGAVSRMLDHCPSKWLAVNPIRTLNRSQKVKKGASRKDSPSLHTMAKFWLAAESEEPTVRDMVHFMLLVPARQSNITEMDWYDVDLRHKTWTIPAPKTKSKLQPLTVQLSPAAIEILRIRKFPTKGEGLVFPRSEGKPFTGFTELKRRLSNNAKVKRESWRFHDFRRSFVSTLAEKNGDVMGHDEVVLDLILNHAASQTRGGVLGVYQTATLMDERKAALFDWSERLMDAVKQQEAEKLQMRFDSSP